MRKKILLILISILFLSSTAVLYAQDTASDEAKKNELQQKIAEYEKKLEDIRNQKNTLSSQIQFMDTQIYLTGLKMQETEKKITQTAKEIDTLESRIKGLDESLNHLSKLFLVSVVNDYKQRSVSVLDLLLDSKNANNLIDQYKYFQAAQNTRQKVFLQATETKLNFEQQKDLREKKQEDLAKLQNQLKSQQVELQSQQDAKRTLLTATQSDESTYKKLLDDARRQIDSFKQFVQISGVGVISPDGLGTGEGGWYYSQRDSRWASSRMGDSSESVLDVGCFITSIAMVMKFYGTSDFTPLNIANNSSYFLPGSAYMYRPDNFSWPNGKRYRNISYDEIKSYLERNIPVIVGVRGSSHYVVLKKIDGDDFIMNDPIYGPDKKVSEYYSISGPYGVFE